MSKNIDKHLDDLADLRGANVPPKKLSDKLRGMVPGILLGAVLATVPGFLMGRNVARGESAAENAIRQSYAQNYVDNMKANPETRLLRERYFAEQVSTSGKLYLNLDEFTFHLQNSLLDLHLNGPQGDMILPLQQSTERNAIAVSRTTQGGYLISYMLSPQRTAELQRSNPKAAELLARRADRAAKNAPPPAAAPSANPLMDILYPPPKKFDFSGSAAIEKLTPPSFKQPFPAPK